DLREAPLGLEELRTRLPSDHRLQLTHELRVRSGADARADQVVRRVDIRDPVPDRLARRLLERTRAELDRAHLGAEELHAFDVGPLAPHVLLAHVDDALEAEACADGRRCDAVLTCAGLRSEERRVGKEGRARWWPEQ